MKIEMADALREFQERHEATVRSDFVLTTIGKEVSEKLDHALAIGKIVVIEGESGSGKTTAAQAWCAQHQGQARSISLSGITPLSARRWLPNAFQPRILHFVHKKCFTQAPT
jgi:ABC-type dipeptide/oligopeptide/nickel transport system ATPase subunit